MLKLSMLLSGLALCVIASPAHAQESRYGGEYASVSGWTVTRDRGFCAMATRFENKLSGAESVLMLIYNQRLNSAKLVFSDPGVTSLKPGDLKKLGVKFVLRDRIDDGWGETDFKVLPSTESFKGAVFSAQFQPQMLDDFARNDTVAFYYGEIILQAYGLDGSALAVKKLRDCAASEASLNPSDPFE